MSLKTNEFLRRFLLHLLPNGFMRIRNFGFLANRHRAALLFLCLQLLGSTPDTSTVQAQPEEVPVSGLWKCPQCGGPMIVILRIGPPHCFSRAPPPESFVGRTAARNSA
jgi:hypothetical protein